MSKRGFKFVFRFFNFCEVEVTITALLTNFKLIIPTSTGLFINVFISSHPVNVLFY